MKLTALISAAMAHKVSTIGVPLGGVVTIEHSIDEELEGLKKDLLTAGGKEFQNAKHEREEITKDIVASSKDDDNDNKRLSRQIREL